MRVREFPAASHKLAVWRPSFRHLRTKLTVYSLALIAAVLLGVIGSVYLSIERNAERAVSGELTASAVVFDRVWQLRNGQLETSAALLARDFGFRAAVATRDQATIRTALQNLRRRVGMQLSFVIGADGQVLASDGEGSAAAASAWLRDAGADAPESGVLLFSAGPHQSVSAPVLAPLPIGEVVFASPIDQQELAALVRLSPIPFHARLLVQNPDGRWGDGAIDLSSEELGHAAAALKAGPSVRPTARKIGPWIEIVRPLNTIGPQRSALLLRYPLAEALAPYRGLFTIVFLCVGCGLGLLAGGAWLVAQQVTRPLDALTLAAKRLEKGEHGAVEVEGRDEIAALSLSFNRMVEGIARREAALKLARDEAEAANRAKSEFLANMSHEIRTPLNGVLGMTQVLELEINDDLHRRRLEIIRRSGESLLAILDSILDLSKIEAGRLQIEVRDFDLAAAVQLAAAPFVALAAEKQIDLQIEISPEAGWRRGDPVRLRQVLANLVANAVKFTEAGAIRVKVACGPQSTHFEVSDTGVGIPSERLSEIFERFAQVDGSATRRFGGTGLGLSICRELVELMGGTLSVQSRLGHGSKFAFDLPLALAAATAAAEPLSEHAPAPPALRVLAAEDNETNRMILSALLEPAGVDLTFALNGREAVAAFAEAPFDLVLMDIQMPEIGGVEATRAIRASEGIGRTPILAVTANVMADQIKEYLAAGMDGVVAKPIQAAALLAAIEAALEPQPAESQDADVA